MMFPPKAYEALDLYVSPVPEVAVIGDPEGEDTRALVAEVTTKRFLLNHVLAVAAPTTTSHGRRCRCSEIASPTMARPSPTCASGSCAGSPSANRRSWQPSLPAERRKRPSRHSADCSAGLPPPTLRSL